MGPLLGRPTAWLAPEGAHPAVRRPGGVDGTDPWVPRGAGYIVYV